MASLKELLYFPKPNSFVKPIRLKLEGIQGSVVTTLKIKV